MRRIDVLKITDEHKRYMEDTIKNKHASERTRRRAYILLYKAEGFSNDDIAQMLGITKLTVIRWIKRYKTEDWNDFLRLFDNMSGRRGSLNNEEKKWIMRIACTDPRDLGCRRRQWNYRSLTAYVSKNAKAAGYSRLEAVHYEKIRRVMHSTNMQRAIHDRAKSTSQ